MSNQRYDAYIICTSPRSGSTLHSSLQQATGKAGLPESLFHTPSLAGWCDAYDLTISDYPKHRDFVGAVFAAARNAGTGDTGMFGLRMQGPSFDFFLQQIAILHPDETSPAARINAAFGRVLFIHLSRPDKLCQAISRVRAAQTGLWHRAADGTELERLSPAQEAQYDPEAIAEHMAELMRLDRAWTDWFQSQNIDPLRISYDALSADPAGCLASLLGALGLDKSLAQGVVPGVARLSDRINREWEARFRAEHPVSGI